MSHATWMADMQKQIGNLKLREVIFPGTHDSGTYDISTLSGFSPDVTPWINAIYALGLSPLVVKKVISDWAKAQGQNITEQLEGGIRYLDLRVCLNDKDMFVVHGMYAENINVVIDAVHNFVTQNNKEIVILDFNHFYEMTANSHRSLVSTLISTFSSVLIPRSKTVNATVNDLWSAKQRVVILYDDETSVQTNSQLWFQNSISSTWPNKQDIASLKEVLQEELQNPPMDKFFVLQGILTPDLGMIAKGLVPFTSDPGSLESLAENVTPVVVSWIKQLWYDKSLNIIIVDWAGMSALVDVIKTTLERRWVNSKSKWVANDNWNDNYFGNLENIYADTNEVVCPPGKVVIGFSFYKKGGNRVAPMILCATPEGNEKEWVKNSEWNDNYFGPLENIYADTNELLCLEGKAVTGFAFWKKGGNRIAPKIRTSDVAGGKVQWVQNDDWNQDYFGNLESIYADVNELSCQAGSITMGFSFWKKGGNRIAPRILSSDWITGQ